MIRNPSFEMFLANLFERRQFVDSGVINQDLDLAKAGSLERSSSHETLGLGQEESSFDHTRDSHCSRWTVSVIIARVVQMPEAYWAAIATWS